MVWGPNPPYPAPPLPRVYLSQVGHFFTEITSYLSQETAPVLTSTIENPVDTNAFTAADITLKGYDPTGAVKALFASILPTSVDFAVLITLGLPGADSTNPGALLYQNDVAFNGFVAPSTLQFNPKDFSFSFTVIGLARNLQTTDASTLFLRSGYTDTKWKLYQDAAVAGITPSVLVTAGGTLNFTCDFQAGDTIQLGDNDQLTVIGVAPDTSASPPLYWQVSLVQGPQAKYPAGAAVVLLTPYQRNVSLHDAVAALFNAAGFPAEGYFGSAALPNLGPGAMFATPMNLAGLPTGPVSGIAPFSNKIVAGTPGGIYQATSPTSGFTLLAPYKLAPVDPTNSGTNYVYTGPKRTKTRLNAPRYGLNITMKFYAYDWKQYGGTFNRYILTVNCNTDEPDTGAGFAGFTFSTRLDWEVYNTGSDSWGGGGNLWAGVSSTTLTDLSAAYDAIGIDVDPASGTILFTDIDVPSAGTAATLNTSSYQPTGATPGTGTLTRARATSINGATVFIVPGYVCIFQTDGILGLPPTMSEYSVAADGTMTFFTAISISPYVVGRSIKLNRGDNRYYMLISDPQNGISLTSWPVGGLPDSLLFPGPPPAPVQSPNLLRIPWEVDLMCLPNGAPGAGPYPMLALVGGTPFYISNSGSGLIPYLDLTGLSVGDALQQLTVINAGIFYVAGFGWVFRSRSDPWISTIGTNDQIDGDGGFLSLVVQPVFNRWVGYVRIENENDATIFGEAGNVAYSDSDLGLTLKSRFVSSVSFARALALSLFNYIGSSKRYVELERVRDGRTYEVGRTFHCNADGANRRFQVIETGHPATSVTVKVTGLEI